MTDAVETDVFNYGSKEISTNVIGEYVMQQLKDVDEVAYVRFPFHFFTENLRMLIHSLMRLSNF